MRPAQDLAFAARGNIKLASVVPAGIPELDVAASGSSIYGDDSKAVAVDTPDRPTSHPNTDSSASSGEGGESQKKDGCSLASGSGGQFWLGLLLLGLFWRRRRRS